MKLSLTLSTILGATLLAGAAFAQPRAIGRGRPPAPPGHSKHDQPPPPPVDMAALCRSRQSVLEQEQNRLEAAKGALAGADTEIAMLERRLDELKRTKVDLATRIRLQETKVKALEGQYGKDCSASQDCQQYDVMAGSLKVQSDGIERDMATVQSQMAGNQTEISSLRTAIEPLRNEYNSLACNNLVPGETAQTTIDRCSAIFSDWNRLQARLNQQNQLLASLKARYSQLYTELKNIEARANGYETYMAKNCASSPRVAELRGYGGVRKRAELLGGELDKMIEDVAKLKGIQITVQAK